MSWDDSDDSGGQSDESFESNYSEDVPASASNAIASTASTPGGQGSDESYEQNYSEDVTPTSTTGSQNTYGQANSPNNPGGIDTGNGGDNVNPTGQPGILQQLGSAVAGLGKNADGSTNLLGEVAGGIKDLFTGQAFGGGVAGALAGVAAAGITAYAVGKLLAPSPPSPPPDRGQALQLAPSQDLYIPVLYGHSTFAGIITDCVQSNSNDLMTYCVTLCEQTGNLLSTGAPSSYTFNKIYWNDLIVNFQSDGVTLASTTDRTGYVDTKLAGLVKIYCYVGGSAATNQVAPVGTTLASTIAATSLVPTWDSTFQMNNLIFFIVQVTYNLSAGATGIPNMSVTLTNSMNAPGDVFYDYMTNSVYGCGIPSTMIAT